MVITSHRLFDYNISEKWSVSEKSHIINVDFLQYLCILFVQSVRFAMYFLFIFISP